MRATPNLNFTTVEPTAPSLKTFVTMLRSVYQHLTDVINGKIGFGDGTNHDNIDGAWINVVAPAAPNTDFTVTHNLGRLPVGYWPMVKDRACDIYTGSVAATNTQLTLRATVASAVLRLFIVGLLLGVFVQRSEAQGANHTNIAFGSVKLPGNLGVSSPVAQPIPNAVITVCNGSTLPAAGTVCLGTTLIYSNAALTNILSNPTNADANGNYTFYANAGFQYVVSVSGTGFATYSYVWSAPILGSSNLVLTGSVSINSPGSLTVSGAATLTGATTATNLQGCQYVNANQTFAQALAAVSNPGCIEVTPGTYPVSVNAAIPAGVTLVSKSGGLLSIANAVTLTVNGQIVAPAIQIFSYTGTGTAVVAQGNVEALWFPGANLGVQVNNAALALNSAKAGGNTHGAGKIHIASGTYSVPLGVMNPQADIILSCDSIQSTAISFTGASGAAILWNVGTPTGTYYEFGTGIENCQIYGPGWPSGSGQAGTGILLGDASHAVLGFKMSNSFIAGFTLGMAWGANSQSWATKVDHTVFTLNTQDFVYNPNSGGGTENVELDHVIFAPSYGAVIANDVVIGPGSSITDIWFSNCSFDNGELVVSNASSVGLSKPHFEYGFNSTTPFAAISGGAFVSMFNPVVQYDPSSGSTPTSVFSVNNSTLDLYAVKINSNVASIANYVNATSTNLRVWGTQQLNNVGGITSSASRIFECWQSTGSCQFSLIGGNFTINTSGNIQMQGPITFGPTNTLLFSTTAPTIAGAGCGGTVAAIQNANGTASFDIFTGTAPTSGGCTITMPAAAHHWHCEANHTSAISTTNFIIQQTDNGASTTSVTLQLFSDVAAATAPAASDTWRTTCTAN